MTNTEVTARELKKEQSDTEIRIVNPFTKHPQEVGMTYLGHFRFALLLFRQTSLMALASLIHAFLPFLFVTYTGRNISRIYQLLQNRKPIIKNEYNND